MLRDEVNQLQSADQLRQALARTQQALVKAKFAKDELISAVYQAAKDAALAVDPVRVKPIAKDKRTGKPEVALVHLTVAVRQENGELRPDYVRATHRAVH